MAVWQLKETLNYTKLHSCIHLQSHYYLTLLIFSPKIANFYQYCSYKHSTNFCILMPFMHLYSKNGQLTAKDILYPKTDGIIFEKKKHCSSQKETEVVK